MFCLLSCYPPSHHCAVSAPGGQEPFLSCSLLYPKCLEWGLARNRCSINMWHLRGWVTLPAHWEVSLVIHSTHEAFVAWEAWSMACGHTAGSRWQTWPLTPDGAGSRSSVFSAILHTPRSGRAWHFRLESLDFSSEHRGKTTERLISREGSCCEEELWKQPELSKETISAAC